MALLWILGLLLSGLIVGALGRLVIPGPNPMSIVMTTAVGIDGALLDGLVGADCLPCCHKPEWSTVALAGRRLTHRMSSSQAA